MDAHKLLGLALQASIMLTVLGFGLTVTLSQATYLFRHPPLLLRAVLSMSVLMPVVVALFAHFGGLRFEVAAALVALAVSPVPPMIQKTQLSSGSRIEYVAGLLVAMSVLAIVLVPLSLWILDRVFDRHGEVTFGAIARIMALTVLAPLAVGLAARHVWPAVARASRAVLLVAGILLGLTALVLLYGMWPTVRSLLGVGTVLAMIVVAGIGILIGHLLGGPLASDRTALAISTASRHPAVALAVATSGSLTDTKAELALILLYLIVATIVALPYEKWRARGARAAPHG